MKKINFTLLALASLTASQYATANEQGDVLVRAGLAAVIPNDSSSNIVVGNDLGVGVSVDNNVQLGLTFAYFVTDRINIEVLAATPFKHQIDFSANDPLGTGNQLGDVGHLPPTVTANYYFNDLASSFQPYVGAGLNYTLFFNDEFTSENGAAGLQDLSLDNSFGLAAQIGADYIIDDTWFVNAAVRWIDIDTSANFNLNGTAGSVQNIEIDPWVYSVSIGYRF